MKKIKKLISIILAIISLLFCTSSLTYAYADFLEKSNNKISEHLNNAFDSSSPNEKISTIAWISESSAIEQNQLVDIIDQNSFSSDMTEADKIDLIHKYRAAYAEQMANENIKNSNKYIAQLPSSIEIEYVSDYSPVIVLKGTKSDIQKISRKNFVSELDIKPTESRTQLDISKKTTKASTMHSPFNYKGAGINIGIIESGSIPITNDVFSGANIVMESPNAAVNSHATVVAQTIVGQQTSNSSSGVSPEANLYIVDKGLLSASLDWLISKSVDIINISVAYGYNDSNGNFVPYTNQYRANDKMVDYYIQKYNVSITVSAGNYSSTGVSTPGMAYNAITVANSDCKGTALITDDVISSSSSYINSTNLNGIATKPDITAPGTQIDFGGNVISSGTSLSAPHVAGTIALIGSQNSMLLVSPVAIKAIICAGVDKNRAYVPSNRNGTNSYKCFGAGIVNCFNNCAIVTYSKYDYGVSPNGTVTSTDTINCSANKNVRVALAILNNIQSYSESTSANFPNVDIEIYNPSGIKIASSETSNNNLEIVNFTTSVEGNYTLKIINRTTNAPQFYYGLAWT